MDRVLGVQSYLLMFGVWKPRDIGSSGISLGSIFVALLFVSLKLTWPHVSYLKAVMAKEDYWDVLLVLRINGLFHPYRSRL